MIKNRNKDTLSRRPCLLFLSISSSFFPFPLSSLGGGTNGWGGRRTGKERDALLLLLLSRGLPPLLRYPFLLPLGS